MKGDWPSWLYSPAVAAIRFSPGCGCCEQVDVIGYSTGGRESAGGAFLRAHDEFDLGADAWTGKLDLPLPERANLCGVIEGGKIHALGGVSSTTTPFADKDNDEYTPGSNSWAADTNCPDWIANLAGFCLADKAYIVAGNDRVSVLRTVRELSSGTWTTKTQIDSVARNSHGCCRIDDAGFYFGGNTLAGISAVTEEYVVDSWTIKTSMTTARSPWWAASPSASLAVVIGGVLSPGSTDVNESYDKTGDAWTSNTSASTDIVGASGFGKDGLVVFFGGSRPSVASDDTESYELATDSYSAQADMIQVKMIGAGCLNAA